MAEIMNYGERHPSYPNVELADLSILKTVSDETGYDLNTLAKIYGYESSYGQDPDMNTGVYQGPFQIGPQEAEAWGIDRYDLYQSAKASVLEIPKRRESLQNNIANTSGNFEFINSLEKPLLDYLLHQQGGKGMARLSLAYTEDNTYYYNLIRPTLLKNLSKGQQRQFKKTKTYQDAIDYYINATRKNLESK
jgi:hypothetical protein